MIRALVWKEVREQWAVWLILALTTAGGVAGLQQLLSNSINHKAMLISALYIMVWVYGLVCGSLLFASETEDETQTFLDTLPGTRWRLWLIKAGTGLGLLMAQVMILVGIGFAFFRAETDSVSVSLGVTGLLFCGVIGYAWGLFCGVLAPNVLNAIGRAIVLQIAAQIGSLCIMLLYTMLMRILVEILFYSFWPLDYFLQFLFDHLWLWDPFQLWLPKSFRVDDSWPTPLPLFLLFTGLLATVAMAGSQQIYCGLDRLRGNSVNRWQSILFWFSWRQLRWFILGVALLGLLELLFLLPPNKQ